MESSSSVWGGAPASASASSGSGETPSSGAGYGGYGGCGGAPAGGPPAGGGGSADPAEIAACLGMGDFLPEGRGGGAANANALSPQAPAAGGGEIPAEVLGRAGTEFAHDGGYSYRITSDGGFEITVAPGNQGVGYVITQHGEYASAWQTLADFVVAMGPTGGAAPKGGGKESPKGAPWGAKPAPGGAEHDAGGEKPEKAPASETEKNRPKRPSNPSAQMSSLLTAA